MTAQEQDDPWQGADDVDRLPIHDLARLAHAAATALAQRLASSTAVDDLAPVVPAARPGDWGAMLAPGTLPPGQVSKADAGSGSVRPFKPFLVPRPVDPDAESAPASSPLPGPSRSDRSAHDECPAPVDPPASDERPVLSARLLHSGASDPLTLPALHQVLETVARSVSAAQMSLAGHTAQVFDHPAERSRMLGMPEGKTAFRDTADYLRCMLHVELSEARKRLRHAAVLGETRALTGETLPPQLPRLAHVVQNGELDRASVEHVNSALTEAGRMADRAGVDPALAERIVHQGEQLMVDQATYMDPRNLQKVCQHWLRHVEAAVDPDGREPVDRESPHLQGLVHKGKRNGFHQWLLSANDAQHEILMTVASAAANPRARQAQGEPRQVELEAQTETGEAVPPVDPRTAAQKRLDGLIACLSGGLAAADSNSLPWTGGMRPQVAVTIDYKTLLGDLVEAGVATDEDLERFQSSAAFGETIHPQTIRTIACDADVLPVLLGGEGQVLDVGRTQRLFPARLRQAIAARDGGCAAPGCGIPAPWCDVHHVEHWEHGGPTSTDNGVLLCNHHHHSVHAGAWDIDMRSGRPWFIPAPYLDPRRRPQRNRYWRQS